MHGTSDAVAVPRASAKRQLVMLPGRGTIRSRFQTGRHVRSMREQRGLGLVGIAWPSGTAIPIWLTWPWQR